jgi:hypothetical protein
VARVPHVRAYSSYGGERERPPSDLAPELLVDEATLDISPDEFCFNILVRAPRQLDQPLDMFDYECSVDGDDRVGRVVQSEPSATTEHPFVGEAPRLTIRGHHGRFSFPVGDPQERVFRIVERRAQVCCRAVPTETLELTMSGRVTDDEWVRLEWGWELMRRRGPRPPPGQPAEGPVPPPPPPTTSPASL